MILVTWGDPSPRPAHEGRVEEALRRLTKPGDLVLLAGGPECDRVVLPVARGLGLRVAEAIVDIADGGEMTAAEWVRVFSARHVLAGMLGDRGLYLGSASRRYDGPGRGLAARLAARGARLDVVRLPALAGAGR